MAKLCFIWSLKTSRTVLDPPFPRARTTTRDCSGTAVSEPRSVVWFLMSSVKDDLDFEAEDECPAAKSSPPSDPFESSIPLASPWDESPPNKSPKSGSKLPSP